MKFPLRNLSVYRYYVIHSLHPCPYVTPVFGVLYWQRWFVGINHRNYISPPRSRKAKFATRSVTVRCLPTKTPNHYKNINLLKKNTATSAIDTVVGIFNLSSVKIWFYIKCLENFKNFIFYIKFGDRRRKIHLRLKFDYTRSTGIFVL